jgi:ribonuclease-3
MQRFPAARGRPSKLAPAGERRDAGRQGPRDLDLGRWLRLGKGEEERGGRRNRFSPWHQALLGAVYLDAGFEAGGAWSKSLWPPT